jgi:hypothetical protein
MRGKARWYVTVLVILGWTTVARSGDGQRIDPAWADKAGTEIKRTLEKYKEIAAHLEEVSEVRYDKAAGPAGQIPFNPHTRRDCVIRLGDDMIVDQVHLFDKEPDKPQIRLQCDNGDYDFTLGKAKEDSAYVLVTHGSGKRKLPLASQGGFGMMHGSISYQLMHALAAIEKDAKYTLRALRFDDAKSLLLIEYTSGKGTTNRVYIDPARDWRVVETWVETPSLVGTDQYSYGEVVGGMTFPTEIKDQTTYKIAAAPPNLAITMRLVSIKLTDKTAADFRLSAFGLPEPMGMPPVSRGGSYWYIWFALAGFVCVGLGAWWRARIRRRPSMSPSEVSSS